ncbi:MAG TPA: antitoxin [Desulfobacteraceae bacterium]|nr:antitoxin [Desulfobacteraceae bacterium]
MFANVSVNEFISINPKICHGQACVRGTRIPVHQVIRMLANGDTVEELLEDYPSLKREYIFACLNYAASLAEEQISPIDLIEQAV